MPAGFLEYLDHFDKRPFLHIFAAVTSKTVQNTWISMQ